MMLRASIRVGLAAVLTLAGLLSAARAQTFQTINNNHDLT